ASRAGPARRTLSAWSGPGRKSKLSAHELESTMNHRPSTLALLALSLLRCVQRGADADAAGDMSGVPPDDAEGRIHCTYAYRQTNVASDAPSPAALQFEERTLELGAGDVAGATLGQLTLTARYSSDELEGSSFSLSV